MLEGKRLRYLIGANGPQLGHAEEVTVVGYDTGPAQFGVSVGYCNLFDEKNTGRLGPYLHNSDTAAQYGEGQIDPRGPGWEKNLRAQFTRRRRQGFQYIELDNPDAYSMLDVLRAVSLAATYRLGVIAKNPLLVEGNPVPYIQNTHGAIVERGAGSPRDMDAVRIKASRPDLPVWFVSFGSGRNWAEAVGRAAVGYKNMWVSYSSKGEYGNSLDINGIR